MSTCFSRSSAGCCCPTKVGVAQWTDSRADHHYLPVMMKLRQRLRRFRCREDVKLVTSTRYYDMWLEQILALMAELSHRRTSSRPPFRKTG